MDKERIRRRVQQEPVYFRGRSQETLVAVLSMLSAGIVMAFGAYGTLRAYYDSPTESALINYLKKGVDGSRVPIEGSLPPNFPSLRRGIYVQR